MIKLVPAYTLEQLDACDIDRMLPYYLYDYRRAKAANEKEKPEEEKEEIVIRDGKKYKKVKAKNAAWASNIF